ncbi:MAG: succinate dehydrogenase/fumarate reductase iron-sulfur subunit [Deltaproteobacteria bacterium]|nr:succinate dehydrogenase/fumarate reductase iron-sulfur subunit [Deltaproteobacteria bacterium]
MRSRAVLRVYRGDRQLGTLKSYEVETCEGMVVLDAIHQIQAKQDNELACRWNCKAGKCGSCSAEINGQPRLMCMTRMDRYQGDIIVEPLKTFPIIKDLVNDVSWNYEVNRKIKAFHPKPQQGGTLRMQQYDVDRVQEFRKCIECFLCQDVCHVLRDHNRKDVFAGPRFLVRLAGLEMHPHDVEDRLEAAKNILGTEYCNITKCCTDVCPESIRITDNAIIPLKERLVSRYYDPVAWVWRKITGKRKPV